MRCCLCLIDTLFRVSFEKLRYFDVGVVHICHFALAMLFNSLRIIRHKRHKFSSIKALSYSTIPSDSFSEAGFISSLKASLAVRGLNTCLVDKDPGVFEP